MSKLTELEEIARLSTPQSQEGTWTLRAPDGRIFQGPSPLHVAGQERKTRVPDTTAAARVLVELATYRPLVGRIKEMRQRLVKAVHQYQLLDSFDGDFDTLDEAINALSENPKP